jgi:3-hydroxybutyryl-CoA dehydrogenase
MITQTMADRMHEADAQLRRVAVIGAGTMGRGIAQVAALGGLETTLFDVDTGALEQAQQAIASALRKGVELGKVAADAAERARTHLRTTSLLEDAARGTDLVIEAVPEESASRSALPPSIAPLRRMQCSPPTLRRSRSPRSPVSRTPERGDRACTSSTRCI